jgi:hypothetical protein
MRRLLLTVVIALAAGFGGCNCAKPGKPQGSPCEKAADCQGNLVCSPTTNKCDTVGCTSDSQCGTGAACDASTKQCVDNKPGGSCSTDANCVNGEQCRGDKCFPQGSAGGSCTTTEQCTAPLVCNPSTSKCADGSTVTCTGNADCGNAAFCNNGNCAPASGTSPCSSNANCASGDQCLGNAVCVPAGCQTENFVAAPVKPNMMIVFDRSGSMNDPLDNNGGTKISVAISAISNLVTAHDADIRFGFAPFPGDGPQCDQNTQQCSSGLIAVDIADNTGSQIVTFLNNMGDISNCRGTPTGDQFNAVDADIPLRDTTRPDFIILMTDGAANCGADPPTAIANLAGGQGGQFPPVKTFVIGFGSGVDATQLTDMSNAGGEPLPGNPNYYQADSAQNLNDIFTAITSAVLGCDYTLTGAGNDPNALLVFFNGQSVPRDATHATGWDYDPSTSLLHFAGNACVALQSGSVSDLSIAFGCPGGTGGEGEGEGAGGEGEGEGAGGEGEGEGGGNCGGTGAQCTKDTDCCAGFLCNQSTHQCLFLGG